MKLYLRHKTPYTIILVFVFQLLISYCAKQAFPGRVFINIENTEENKKLKSFLDSGIEKNLDTNKASPDQIIKTAREYLGVPHCMGGTTRKCMDCSGLLVAVFSRYDIRLPHNSEEQAKYGRLITVRDELRKGDLVFFIRSYNTERFITHSGIYLGKNEFIHASSNRGVTITSIDDSWWGGRFIFGTRLFE